MNLKLPLFAALIFFTGLNAFAANAPADFAGEWTWDRARCKDLPPMLSETKTWQLVVSGADKELKVEVNIETGRPQNPTVHHTFSYPLDGTQRDTTSQMFGPGGPQDVPTHLSGKTVADGTLELTVAREVRMKDQTRTMTQLEKWELSADKRSLTIHMTTDMPSGPVKYDLVFARK